MDALLAAGSGLVAGSLLLVGVVIAWLFDVPDKVVAGIMAFGSGALISALAFELVAEAHRDGGLVPTVIGFALGAGIYVVADVLIDRRGRRGRAGTARSRSGNPILVGALIDGIPESVVLGLSVAATGGLSLPIIAAIAISNLPEGLSSAAAMKHSGESARWVFGGWSAVVLASTVAALLGFLLLQNAPVEVIAVITTVAAGGILAMVCNTMIPDAFREERALTGLWATLGFLAAFTLSNLFG